MWMRTFVIGAGAIVALVVSAGCSGSESTVDHSGHSASASTSATAAPGTGAHNDADVMFAQHMIPHHQQAVQMSDVVLDKQGIDSRVTGLAKQIKAAQAPEITQMQDWLGQWGNPPMPPMVGMSDHAMGMMSGEQMDALKSASGVDAARLFLTGMIAHHEGAITMAQDEIRDGQFDGAIDMAHAIVASQQQEIATMKGILATL
jgi:uncharacterized protein (DUF305 family)